MYEVLPVMRVRLRRVRAVLTTLKGFVPLTPLGALWLALALTALVPYGLHRVDLVLLVIGSVGVALTGVSALLVTGTAIGVYVHLRGRSGALPFHAECGHPGRTGFSLPSLWYIPLVNLTWTWESPEATVRTIALRRHLHEEITPTRRGVYEEIHRRVVVSDAFGLTRVSYSVRETRSLRFAPSVGALRHMHVVRSIAGGDALPHPAGPPEGERADMRPYAPGDPIRYVLWKVFARSRQLMVRTPERAIAPVRQTVAYLVAGDGDEAAAGAARVAVDSGALGSEWVLGADGVDEIARTSLHALDVLARSALTLPDGYGAGLSSFLTRSTPGSVGRAVVFVPGRPGPWLDRVIAAARARTAPNQPHAPVEFVVCTDGISRSPKRSWLSRLALRTGVAISDGTVDLTDVNTVVGALNSARARVLIVDRLAGKVYADGHRPVLRAA